MRVLMSEKMLEELVSDVEIGIDYNPDVHQEWCDEAHEALGNILAELRSLRAECERLKARQVPNLDAMRFDQLETIGNDLDRLNAYVGSRMNLLATDPKYKPMIEKRLESYYSKIESPWAKFREE